MSTVARFAMVWGIGVAAFLIFWWAVDRLFIPRCGAPGCGKRATGRFRLRGKTLHVCDDHFWLV